MQESIQSQLPPRRDEPVFAIPPVDIAQRDSDVPSMTPSDWNVVGWIGSGIIVVIGFLIQYATTAVIAATLVFFAVF